jgi:hypothetical protein
LVALLMLWLLSLLLLLPLLLPRAQKLGQRLETLRVQSSMMGLVAARLHVTQRLQEQQHLVQLGEQLCQQLHLLLLPRAVLLAAAH